MKKKPKEVKKSSSLKHWNRSVLQTTSATIFGTHFEPLRRLLCTKSECRQHGCVFH